MKRLLEQIAQTNRYKKEAPLETIDIIQTQKTLVKDGYPFLPVEFIEFLKHHNGLSATDSAVLGILKNNSPLDICTYNKVFNAIENTAILAYDDMTYLVFDNDENTYKLVDRTDFVTIDEYLSGELVYALNSILHF